MAILPKHHIPAGELGPGKTYTHWGTIHGWVPVYMGDLHSAGPSIAVRNWWPDWLEPLGRWMYLIGAELTELLIPGYECPGFIIRPRGTVEVVEVSA